MRQFFLLWNVCHSPCAGVAWIVMTILAAASVAGESPGRRVEFNRDIRSILSDKCFSCHGPDSAKRQSGLRLDLAEESSAERLGARAIVPSDVEASEVVRRILSVDPTDRMPPPQSNPPLTEDEVSLIKTWIEQGAKYQPHWSFVAPRAVIPPAEVLSSERERINGETLDADHDSMSANPIDSFVRSRLSEIPLSPAPAADRPTVLRRVSFDLIGLPPTIADVDQFVADVSPDAFEKQIDRLLASPRYGERMATLWLDAARYADTNGYQTDGPRFMWRWRDWVIDAWNRNQPYDQFTMDQLAGDLMERSPQRLFPFESPPSTPATANTATQRRSSAFLASAIANDRLIATGFNRNHRGNAEGGIIPEEFRIEYVVDRVETTATVWLGLTIGCARCHDHKYDPISQREFYQLFAFFNQLPEPGKYLRNNNSMPYLPAPTRDQQRRLAALENVSAAAEWAWQGMASEVSAGIAKMSAAIHDAGQPIDWTYSDGLEAHFAFEDTGSGFRGGDAQAIDSGGWHDGEAQFSAGRLGHSVEFDGKRWLDAGDAGDFGEEDAFAISLWVMPRGRGTMTVLARMDEENARRGYELMFREGHLQAVFSARLLDDLIRVETQQTLPENTWSHVIVTYDGHKAARGVTIRIDGTPAELTVITDLLSNRFKTKPPLKIGSGGSAPPFKGRIDELRFYRGLPTNPAAISLAVSETILQLTEPSVTETLPARNGDKLREFYLRNYASEPQRQAWQSVLDARSNYIEDLAAMPTTMVMQDQPGLRETHILNRGEYDKPGAVVQTGVPAALPPIRHVPLAQSPDGSFAEAPLDRLDLARWLVSTENPLSSRVTVNRLWQMLFGMGLVKTSEDFGTQGESPSHPELLDWLAVEFAGKADREMQHVEVRSANTATPSAVSQGELRAPNFDIKRILRVLVSSATYRQSSRVDGWLQTHDPENRWLARGPRFRLPAQMVRDAALATSELLVESLGGPSVKPYQPAGLWEELSAEAVPGPFAKYVQDHGASLYRRSLYTYQKRTVTTPGMAIFDASSRDFCRVKLPRTNTPLQALNLMNDVTYLEAARILADQTIRAGGGSTESRIIWAFRRVLSRSPDETELTLLVRGFDRRRTRYQQSPELASQILQAGESPVSQQQSPAESAAYAATISVLFNLDEFVERP